MTNWLTSRANRNTVNTAKHAGSWISHLTDAVMRSGKRSKVNGDFIRLLCIWFSVTLTLFFGHRTLHTVSQHRSCIACKSKILQLLSSYELWTIDSHAANGPRKGAYLITFSLSFTAHCLVHRIQYLSNDPKGQWMRFYCHPPHWSS